MTIIGCGDRSFRDSSSLPSVSWLSPGQWSWHLDSRPLGHWNSSCWPRVVNWYKDDTFCMRGLVQACSWWYGHPG
jgi:hypothetical protein